MADNACELIGVCAARADDAAALAHALETDKLADLRQAMLSPDAEVIWLATHAPIDDALVKAIRERSLLVLTSEPNPELLVEGANETHDAEVASFVPAFVDGKGFSAALDTLEQFGKREAMNLVFASRPEHGSLFARLFDAVTTVHTALGDVELIDASMTVQRSSVPEQLVGLTGTMTINMRIAGNRTASALISNVAPYWSRQATILGEDAHMLRITESHCDWIGENDSPIGSAASAADSPMHDQPGPLIADRLMRFMQLPNASRSPADGARLLAMCEAARLSARVGFAEAPGAISQMLSRM